MAGGEPTTEASGTGPVVLLTKLTPPPLRDQTLMRDALLARLDSAAGRRLVLVAAPAGYGKTTLLAGWCAARGGARPIAWMTLDEADNDPVVLWAHLIRSLRGVCPALPPSVMAESVGAASLLDGVLPRLVNELADQPPVTLVLDDFHRLSSGSARDSITWWLEHAPRGAQLVIASRSEPRLPLASLRAHGELFELRADDLRFTFDEAEDLLNRRLGLGLTPADVSGLVQRTEGWPAGLYLAALSLAAATDRHALVARFETSHRHLVDFFADEVLSGFDAGMQDFMVQTSVLDRMCGPLCDAVTGQPGSAAVLADLARSNLFLVPLDNRGEWYRYHQLFGQFLRVELEHRAAGLVPTLHGRASAWHREQGTAHEAITHALDADDFPTAAELIEHAWIDFANECRFRTVRAWLDRFPAPVLEVDARLLLVQAWVLSLCAERWAAAGPLALLERSGQLNEGPLADGFVSVESSLTTIKAVFPWGDIGAQIANGRQAAEMEGPDSRWQPVALWAVGVGNYLAGKLADADQALGEASDRAVVTDQWLVAGSACAYRSLLAAGSDRREQRRLAERASQLVDDYGLQDVVGEARIALALSRMADGEHDDVLSLVEAGIAAMRSWGQPTELANALILVAPVVRGLGQADAADAMADEARALIDTCSDPGTLRTALDVLEHNGQDRAEPGDHRLTESEVRVLRLLGTDASERDIAETLFVSFNTVHTHVQSIYRKLGVRSRGDAVVRARSLGVLQVDLT